MRGLTAVVPASISLSAGHFFLLISSYRQRGRWREDGRAGRSSSRTGRNSVALSTSSAPVIYTAFSRVQLTWGTQELERLNLLVLVLQSGDAAAK